MTTLGEMLASGKAYDAAGKEFTLHSGLNSNATQKITVLVRQLNAKRTLEIGMAMGCSTLSIFEGLSANGLHTAIDPNQTLEGGFGWHGIGLESVKRAGFAELLRLIEKPSYQALPQLLGDGEQFDFILIDGWHSFDYTFVDYFYSDLLLVDGGILVIDDWRMPQVHHVTKFIETHKPYERLGPKASKLSGLRSGLANLRLRLTGNTNSGTDWGSIVAYRKLESTQVSSDFHNSAFYPYHRRNNFWGKLRGGK
jgi:predicted O-methyltransferase YrrM